MTSQLAPPPAAGRAPAGPLPDAAQQVSGGGKWWTLVAVSVAIFMLLVDLTIVNVALPNIASALGARFSDLQWVVDAYALALAAFLLTAGSLGDRIGRRAIFVVGIALFTVASLGCGLSTSSGMLIGFRALQGVGGAVVFATSLALLAAEYRGRDRGTAFGVYGAVTGASSAIGPLVGGAVVTGLSWRWIFFINVPVGVVAVAISLARLRESRDPAARRIDVPGVLTFSLGLALVVYALIRGDDQGWASAATLGELGAGVVLLALFVVVERRSTDPMLDLSLFRLPAFVGAQVAAFTISAALFSLFLYFVLYLQNVLGYSALETGVRLLAVSAMALVLAPLAGRLTVTVPYRVLIGSGLVFLTVGLLLMARVDAGSTWWVLFPGLLLAGAGIGAVNAPMAALAVGVVDPRRAGVASGINSTARQIGLAMGTAAFGAVFTTHVSRGVDQALTGSPVPAAARADLDEAVTSGVIAPALAQLPAALRTGTEAALLTTFTSGLTIIFLAAAALAGIGALLCFVLIRQRDVRGGGGPHQGPPGGPSGAAVGTRPAPLPEHAPDQAHQTDQSPPGVREEHDAPQHRATGSAVRDDRSAPDEADDRASAPMGSTTTPRGSVGAAAGLAAAAAASPAAAHRVAFGAPRIALLGTPVAVTAVVLLALAGLRRLQRAA